MPKYKFKDKMKEIAEKREVALYDSHDRLIWDINKALENSELTAEEVPDKLKDNTDFRLKFNADDFEEIIRTINE